MTLHAVGSVTQRMQRPALWLFGAAVASCASSCGGLDAAPIQHLELRLARPANSEGLFLNEDLVFYFSDEVDRASVTSESVRIRSSDGRPARGTLHVDGDRVRFVPASVLAFDLSDGGYLPGTQYTVTLAGFPRPDGLRGVNGLGLSRTYLWTFRTVSASTPRTGLIFDDRMQDRFSALRPFPVPPGGQSASYVIGLQDSIFLACDKPIDPSTIHDEDFELITGGTTAQHIGLRARLIENQEDVAPRARPAGVKSAASEEQWARERRSSVIELTPKQALAIGDYRLRLLSPPGSQVCRVRDFGDHPVWDASRLPISVRVVRRLGETSPGILHETFLDTRLRSPVAIAGFDGTAYWGDTGRVEVRFPKAAGTGADGAVTLSTNESRTDVHAVRLELPASTSCQLASPTGCVVLRAQGRMSIGGTLQRSGSASDPMEFQPRETLSEWLARAQAANVGWTVLIAGGDLAIDGEVRVDTPLFLCAGGVIRVAGSVRAPEGQLFLLREGGGLRMEPAGSIAPLVIDPPEARSNPLVEPLRLAVMSSPVPSTGRVARWIGAAAQGSPSSASSKAGGRWSVSYVSEGHPAGAGLEALAPLESPRLFGEPSPLQFLIQLEVAPGGTWDPPFVDCVQMTWEDASTAVQASGGAR